MTATSTALPSADLGHRAARGAAVTMSAQVGRVVVQSVTLIALSRLLTPEDFGLVAAVLAFIGVADLLRDFGLSSAAMQAKTLSRAQQNNLFWINAGTGLLAGVAVYVLADPLADFYHNARLAGIARVLSLVFLLDGLGTQMRAELNRRLQFTSTAIADVGSQSVAAVVAIAIAATGGGYRALVAQELVQAVTELAIIVLAIRWIPGLPRRRADMRSLLSFGSSFFAVQLITYASRNADNVTVGRRFGTVTLGVYNRAFQLFSLPLTQLSAPLTTVALPVLARLQDHPDQLIAFVRRGQNLLLQAALGVFATLASLSPVLIPLVIGDRWRASVPIFQILAVGGVFQAAGYASYWVLLATGRPGASLKYALVVRPFTIGFIVLGSVWGVHGVAAGYAIGLAVAWPLGLWWAARVTRLAVMSTLRPSLRSIACWGLAAVVAWRVPILLVHGDAARLASGIAILAAVLLALIGIVPSFRRDLTEVVVTARMIGKRTPPEDLSVPRSVARAPHPPLRRGGRPGPRPHRRRRRRLGRHERPS
jgi:PST family polysaccharide transporter